MRRPHPATVIATFALVGAWGGPAVAASLIDGRDVKNESLTGRDVRNESLTGRDVRNETLTGRDVRNRSITGADVAANSITGGDVAKLTGRDLSQDSIDGFNIYEDGLGTVPEAAHAATADAVGGLAAAKVHFAKPGGTGDTDVLDLGGLKLRARCVAPNSLQVDAVSTRDDGALHVSYHRGATSSESTAAYRAIDDFDTTTAPFEVVPDGADNIQGTIVYAARDGAVVSVDFLAESGTTGPNGGAAGCLLAGTAIGG